MNKAYQWHQTTTGHIMTVNGVNRWFLKPYERINADPGYEVYEILNKRGGCILRDVAPSLYSAKRFAYAAEVTERNNRYMMKEVSA